MSTVERAVVGRKTPGDGKLEVSQALADALGGDGASIQVRLANGDLGGRVEVMECACAKAGASGKHEHHFVQCDAFRSLAIGTELVLRAADSSLEIALV
jgi:hypothetical protein